MFTRTLGITFQKREHRSQTSNEAIWGANNPDFCEMDAQLKAFN